MKLQRSRLKSIAQAGGLAALFLLLGFATLNGSANGPVEIARIHDGIVQSAEFYPQNKWDAQARPKIRILLSTGETILLNQLQPYTLKHGDYVRVKIWKRRFFGYLTTYEPYS